MGDWSTTKRRHGTDSGWALHKELGERPCDPCYRAKAAYDAERKKQPKEILQSRWLAKAQRKALTRLTHAHLAEYRALYEQAKRELASEAPSGGDQ